ncbi:co-chaperone GroES [Candidatus Marinimicrobia bacterium]|jgi:chaperonin GroES|nr:co-chaperone GroES [Candidatus Neomarinimicrobiota bacterium]MDC0877940.1 co-chaperone GroES [Candidatus Neomarinimicrobiota bacterium]MDC1145393.1 co-chaperone GroES [Candidatus Neomarinimicrobiota bacterium]MDG1090194.1 co-chaperone GroES [Candidatus Neomarinimicrobiota bacterium]MDG1269016.1 co-chaperone GroES [Candidatus Neomarinimicrobiota bacterium]|tara:strand:- start:7668 stop:7943 length:276 start_codon:yes stop_codon:yes gene_type:complete
MALKIKPLEDRVIVEAMAADEKTASGIILPDTAQEKPQQGTVLVVGPGKKDSSMTVKSGDKVLYGKYSGTEINHEGKDLLIMRESDILAII